MIRQDNPVKFTVKKSGRPIVNSGIIGKKYRDMALLYFDLKSKYCEVDSTFGGGIPGVVIFFAKRSLYPNKRAKSDYTLIELPEYEGWMPTLANIGRYTLTVLLIKEK